MMSLRRPGWSRTGGALLAVGLAAMATFAVSQYVGGLEARAQQSVELVEVFVAAGELPVGATGTAVIGAGLVTTREMLRDSVPVGAIARLASIESLVVLERVLPGEVLLAPRFGTAAALPGFFEIPEGMHAMSVEVDVPLGVANIISSGDRVSLIAHVARGEAQDTGEGDAASAALGLTATTIDRVEVQPGIAVDFAGGWAQFVLQDLEVLVIGQRVHEAEDGGDATSIQATQGSVLMTLAVTPEQAERLALATFESDLYATLLPEGATDVETSGATLADLFR